MKSYAETKEKTIFDWEVELLKENPDWDDLEKLSSKWTTCPVGQLSEEIERDDVGRPIDPILFLLGGDNGINKTIQNRNVETSVELVRMIKQRGDVVIVSQRINRVETIKLELSGLSERKSTIEEDLKEVKLEIKETEKRLKEAEKLLRK